jgi:hypothetical protein
LPDSATTRDTKGSARDVEGARDAESARDAEGGVPYNEA